MKYELSEISIDQLANLARGAGVSAQQELPDRLQAALLQRRASDRGLNRLSRSVVSQVLGLVKF